MKKTVDRLLIVAFDGLEVSYVEKWKLSSLLQKEHGSYKINKEYASPDLWSAFLTGKNPENFSGKFVERKTPLLLKKLTRNAPESFKKIGRKVFKPVAPTVKNSHKTIFSNVSESLPFNVFCYNELDSQLKLRMESNLPDVIGNMKRSLDLYRKWITFSNEQFVTFLKLLHSKTWKLAMTHFFFTDYLAHIFFWRKQHFRINYAYLMANNFVRQLTKEIANALVLVVSDHGVIRGEHTSHAYWSFNKNVSWQPRSITDFYKNIPNLIEDSQRK